MSFLSYWILSVLLLPLLFFPILHWSKYFNVFISSNSIDISLSYSRHVQWSGSFPHSIDSHDHSFSTWFIRYSYHYSQKSIWLFIVWFIVLLPIRWEYSYVRCVRVNWIIVQEHHHFFPARFIHEPINFLNANWSFIHSSDSVFFILFVFQMITSRFTISQTTVEDSLNLIHRYHNTIHSTQSNYYIRFYSLLFKLFNDCPTTRSGVLQILIEKIKSLVDFSQLPSSSSSQSQFTSLLNLDVLCMNGSLQQPIHELLALIALILHPVHPFPLLPSEELRFQELSTWVSLYFYWIFYFYSIDYFTGLERWMKVIS